ncbi:divalent metal cation transporter [Phragmitibacter flavus]|uniref:Divalent metal cation transporter n=1 Tax=Phragmitibacter flavus TaxID=2576071 RepID=A0A5R8KBM2_9BACT|nr:divalent metal cation transporter [Phragmitibacter flavus]TLD69657.1 divalent metal cation transporter [Phragmitibacter flavus]
MTPDSSQDTLAAEREELRSIQAGPVGKKFAYYISKSGPGWLQGAITLGGGSLAGAMYLGIIAGNGMLWLQPLAMILGVIMLSAIAYVTLSTQRRPFEAINSHVSPVLGWAWLLAAMMANIVWCMPQFNLSRAAIQQNLFPAMADADGGVGVKSVIILLVLLVVSFLINISYEKGSKGVKMFENILKLMVGVVVISFFGVVMALAFGGRLDWGGMFKGMFLPDFSLATQPAMAFRETIAATGEFAGYWTEKISGEQRDRMMTAFGTAVGINMTFLLPYSMLRKRWGQEHRGLAIFDLSLGLVIPFVLATTCVVIAAASQFHATTGDIFEADGRTVRPAMVRSFNGLADGRVKAEVGAETFAGLDEAALVQRREALPAADRQLSAMLVGRNNFNLAQALEPLTNQFVAQKVFGLGVLGMGLSTIIMLMLINGFVFCEMFNKPGHRGIHLLGCAVSGVGGFFGPFIWGKGAAEIALAVPTSVIAGSMIPIAYFTFFLLMNSRSLLGDAMPKGRSRVIWNCLMLLATTVATVGTVWVLLGKGTMGRIGLVVLVTLLVIGFVGFLRKNRVSGAA